MANIRNLIYGNTRVEQPVHNGIQLTRWIHDGVVVWEKGISDFTAVRIANIQISTSYNLKGAVCLNYEGNRIYFGATSVDRNSGSAELVVKSVSLEDLTTLRDEWIDTSVYASTNIISNYWWAAISRDTTDRKLSNKLKTISVSSNTYSYSHDIESNCYVKYFVARYDIDFYTHRYKIYNKTTFEELQIDGFSDFYANIIDAYKRCLVVDEHTIIVFELEYNDSVTQTICKSYSIYDEELHLQHKYTFDSASKITDIAFFGTHFICRCSTSAWKHALHRCDIGSTTLQKICDIDASIQIYDQFDFSDMSYEGDFWYIQGTPYSSGYQYLIFVHKDGNVYMVGGNRNPIIPSISNYNTYMIGNLFFINYSNPRMYVYQVTFND